MKIDKYSHNFGSAAINKDEVDKVVKALNKVGLINQVRHPDKIDAPRMREEILLELKKIGWSDQVKVDSDRNITITSMKNKISLCIQTGNISRYHSDLLKLETLYRNDKTTASIYIVLKKDASNLAGSNIANYERVINELELYKHIITIPILVIGIN